MGDGTPVDLAPGDSDGTPDNPHDADILLSANTRMFIEDNQYATGGLYNTLYAWADQNNARNFKWYNEAQPSQGLQAIRFTNGRLRKSWVSTGVRRYATMDDLREK